MRTRFVLFPFLIALSLLAARADAAETRNSCKLIISLSPAGSFTASSQAVKIEGSTEVKGKQFFAHQISLDLNTLGSGKPLRDEHMRNKYLETTRYPKAVLNDAVGKDGKFQGNLSLHGVTHLIEGTYQIVGERFLVNFKTKISDYKIPKAKYMGVGVDDEVAVEINLPAAPVSKSSNLHQIQGLPPRR